MWQLCGYKTDRQEGRHLDRHDRANSCVLATFHCEEKKMLKTYSLGCMLEVLFKK
jgi:hypothetical protein